MRTLTVLAATLFFSTEASVFAQLPAFPGAEGVAQYVTGGRGGDVYRVTNLNDTGAGSLRFGVQNAPTSGRTIVFDVSGTINLASSLNFNGRSNITIAGQTAPGGGVTLFGHRLNIENSDNVVVQFLRIRPAIASNADGIQIRSATNVMIDHVTTSWGTDENISATHNSNNVTVQWSTMTQGILNHSFGSLLNGGNYSFHHNLYAHNRSRNPRPQHSGNYLNLDFVNNVIYNPGDRFGYSEGDGYDMNYIGNVGLKGPQGGNTANHLMRTNSVNAKLYVEGNMTDIIRDGLLDLNPVNGGAVLGPTDAYTLSPTRFSTNLPQVTTHTAEQAYIHVLSRAGAVNYRDAHDRDMIRSVMNQEGGHVSSYTQWGSLPALPAGTPAIDSNADGVPDAWATANGFDTSTPLHQTFASDGYTYLEKYIHSLTPYAYAPTNLTQHTIRTSYGNGADAQVNENGGTSAVSSGNGTAGAINVHWDGANGNVNQAMLLKFDLSEILPGSVDNARLDLTAAANITGTHDFKVYGLVHDADGWDWNEETVDFNNAPGLDFDGNSRTLGIDPRYTANGNLATPSNLPLPVPEDVLTLGTFSIGSTAAGETVSFDNLNLAVMLNLAAYFEGEDQQGIVTLILQQTNNSSAASFLTKEGDSLLAPRLIVDATLAELSVIENADFNGDGSVDGRDFLIWQRGYGNPGSLGTGDANGDGQVNAADLAIWQAQYVNAPELTANSVAVPEPTALLLLITSLIGATNRLRFRDPQAVSQ